MPLTPTENGTNQHRTWFARPEAPLIALAFLLPVISILGGRLIAQFFIPIVLWQVFAQRRHLLPLRRLLAAPVIWLLGGLVGWGWISTGWSISPEASASTLQRAGTMLLAGAVALSLTQWQMIGPEAAKRIRHALLAGMAIALICIVSALLFDGGISAFLNTHLSSGKPFAMHRLKQGNLVLAMLTWPLFIALVAMGRVKMAHLALAVSAICLALMPSTTAFMAIAASIACYAGLRLLGRKWGMVVLCTLLIAAPGAMMVCLPKMRVHQTHVEHSWVAMSFVHRLHIWQFAIQRIHDKPIQGWGVKAAAQIPEGNRPIRYYGRNYTYMPLHPHNNFLQSWLELGAIGAGLYIGLAAFIAATIHKAGRQLPKPVEAACHAALVCALTGGAAGFGLWQSWWVAANMLVAMLVIALVLSLLQGQECLGKPDKISDS